MSHSCIVELEGYIIDSGTMQRRFGAVMDPGGLFDIEQFDVGTHEEFWLANETLCVSRGMNPTPPTRSTVDRYPQSGDGGSKIH